MESISKEQLEEFAETLKDGVIENSKDISRDFYESEDKPRTLKKAIERLRDESTPEEYEALITSMFNSLDRKGKRKVIGKGNKFSVQVKKSLYK